MPQQVAAQMTWNASDWSAYETITIASTTIDEDLSDFPVYIDLADLSDYFWASTPTSSALVATDIRVTTDEASPTELPRELVSASSTAKTGELHFKAGTISSTTDTSFRIYYNGTTTGDYASTTTFGSNNVWSAGYIAVYHDGSSAFDSTANNITGSAVGGIVAGTASGEVGSATSYNGTSQYYDLGQPSELNINATPLSICSWTKFDTVPGSGETSFDSIVSKGDTQYVIKRNSDKIEFKAGGSADYILSTQTVNNTDFYYVCGTTDGNNYEVFVNAASGGSGTTGTFSTAATDVWIGSNADETGRFMDGTIDNIRISSVERSAAWMSAEYTNQATTSDFYAVDAAPKWNEDDWLLYDTITIDSSTIDDDLENFPVYVDLSDLSNRFWGTTPSAAGVVATDIRITTNDTTPIELPRELVSASSTAKTGELHFRADSISSTTDTTFRIYYNGNTTGDYVPSAENGAENVWTNSYVFVHHMDQNPATTGSNEWLDSTSYAHTGSEVGTFDATNSVGGRMGNAVEFDADGNYLKFTPSAALEGFSAYTTSAWAYPTAVGSTDWGRILSKWNGSAGDDYHISYTSNEAFNCRHSGSTNVGGPFAQSSGEWYYLNCTYDDADTEYVQLHQNLTEYSSGSRDGSVQDSNQALTIGDMDTSPGSRNFVGYVDEVRVANTKRSDAWLAAEYDNQTLTTSFYSVATATASTTLSDHPDTQVNNTFSFQNVTNESLFAFELTPETGDTTITSVTIDVSGANDIVTSDFSNIRLYRDNDDDAAYDATDELLSAGSFSLSGQEGTISFSADFLATTTSSYVVIADWDAPERGAYMTLDLYPSGLTGVSDGLAVTFFGSVTSIQHERRNWGGGGTSAAIGEPAPAGNGIVSGGGTSGGDEVELDEGQNFVFDANFVSPASNTPNGTGFDNPENVYASDGSSATAFGVESHWFGGFNFNIPSSNTITGIEIKLDGYNESNFSHPTIEFSWDGGDTFTTRDSTTFVSPLQDGTNDIIVTDGGQSELWGRSWSPSEFTTDNFVMQVTIDGDPPLNTSNLYIDAIAVRIYHQASGGTSGGGGAI